jgi:hypothetical protein
MGSGPEDYLSCKKDCGYSIHLASQSAGLASGLMSCGKIGHNFCKYCFPEIFKDFEKMHTDEEIIKKAEEEYFSGCCDGVPNIQDMAEYFAETGEILNNICPFCNPQDKKSKKDRLIKEDFNKYSGFNTKSNSKVRIGEHK